MTKTITMNSTEAIATDKGPLILKSGETYDVEDWIANSFIGRGFAFISVPPSVINDEIKFDGLNVANLRQLAKEAAVPGYKKMHREQLISALEIHRNSIKANPPKQPFEAIHLTKGITAPEFKAS